MSESPLREKIVVKEIEYWKPFAHQLCEHRFRIVNDSNADPTRLEVLPYGRKRTFRTDKMVNHVNKTNQIEEVIFEKAIFIKEFGNIRVGKALDCVSFGDCDGFEAIELFKAIVSGNFE